MEIKNHSTIIMIEELCGQQTVRFYDPENNLKQFS